MIDADGFRAYLESAHTSVAGRSLSKRAAGDYVSNCRRVEMLLGIELDQAGLLPEAVARRIDALSADEVNTRVKSNMQTAVRRYCEYRQRLAAG